MKGKAAALGTLAALAAAAPAHAGTYLCVPSTTGSAVTSGGASGTCNTGATAVQMPSSATDQQTLISLLPYVSFQASGVGGKPTIQIKGANVRLLRASDLGKGDGTGNLILGGGANAYTSTALTGSENLVVGFYHQWTNSNNIIGGIQNNAQGFGGIIGGALNTSGASANDVALFGYSGKATGNVSSVLGGRNNTAAGDYSAIDGGNTRTVSLTDGGADDVNSIAFTGTGTIKSKTLSNMAVYDVGTGAAWIYVPNGKLANCSVVATASGSSPNATATASTYGYQEWVYVTTMSAGNYIDTDVNLQISCPTT